MNMREWMCMAAAALFSWACSKEEAVPVVQPESVTVEDVAVLLSSLPIGTGQMGEVFDAASESALNGYDEEYRMVDLFSSPGQGVGGSSTKAREYERPLRELMAEALARTKTSSSDVAEDYLKALSVSDVQIYWPFSDEWDGSTLPVVTFDPGDEVARRNVGYAMKADGSVEKIMVDEEMARERPVWVVNRNSDADFKSLEMRRREDPSWGAGGGDIIVMPETKASAPGDIRTLILRSFKVKRQFDSWFAGAAEFFVKMGSVDDFSGGMTEAEMRIFEPSITDFMIVVRRNQLDQAIPFNAVLVSEWTEELVSSAFMIVEDDGGTRTTWKASAVVKYNSKSYGVDVEFPINTRDDIVWRGSLSRKYIEKYDGISRNYGDVELVFEFI